MAMTTGQAWDLVESRAGDGIACPHLSCYRRDDCDGARCAVRKIEERAGRAPDERDALLAPARRSDQARSTLASKVAEFGLEDVSYALGLGRAKTERLLAGRKRIPWDLVDRIERLGEVGRKYATAEDLYDAGELFEKMAARHLTQEAIAARCGVSQDVVAEALKVRDLIERSRQPTLFDAGGCENAAWIRASDHIANLAMLRSSVEPALALAAARPATGR